MNPVDKLIQAVSFPRAGEYFSPVCTGWKDNSYKSDIMICLASDAFRVVCKKVHGYSYGDAPIILTRDDWRFDDVSSLLSSLGIEKVTA